MAKNRPVEAETVKKKKNPLARLIIVLVVLALIAAIVLVLLNLQPTGASYDIEDKFQTPNYLKDKVMNILVCGIDMDTADETRVNYMTDVILVAQIDLESNQATLLQIPRDTYVGYDTVYTGKINALYNWGNQTTAKREAAEPAGIGYLIETIYDQFRIPIDHYVMVNMEGFRAAVDTLGGVEVSIQEDMVFNIRDKDENIISTFTMEAGSHLLDGEMADLFVRYREYDNADIDRLNVQRYFMAALLNRLLATPTMDLVDLALAIYDYLETDFTVNELIQLAGEAKQLSADAISTIRVPGESLMDYVYVGSRREGRWIFTVHKKALADLLNEYMRPYTDDVPETELGVIEVQNTNTDLDDTGANLGDYD